MAIKKTTKKTSATKKAPKEKNEKITKKEKETMKKNKETKENKEITKTQKETTTNEKEITKISDKNKKNEKNKNKKLLQLGIGILAIVLIIIIAMIVGNMNQEPIQINPDNNQNTNQNPNNNIADSNTPIKLIMIIAEECKGCFNELTLDDAFNMLDIPTESVIYNYDDEEVKGIIEELEIPQFPIILIDENSAANVNHKVKMEDEEMLLINFLATRFPKVKGYYVFPPAQISPIVFVPNEMCGDENNIRIDVFEDLYSPYTILTATEYAMASDAIKENVEINYHYFKLNTNEFDANSEKELTAAYYAAIEENKVQELKTCIYDVYCSAEGNDVATVNDLATCNEKPHYETALTTEEINSCLDKTFISKETYQKNLEAIDTKINADKEIAEKYAIIEGEIMPISIANCQTKTLSVYIKEQVCAINSEIEGCATTTTELTTE